MAKNKLKRFEENKISNNVVQDGKPIYKTVKNHWNDTFFKNTNPITLEIGCGNGEYTVGLAQIFPEKNFIGVDIKGARIYKGSTEANENKLLNVGFLRSKIEFLHEFFDENEVDEIWITFPDPQLKEGRDKHRLTHPKYLNLYKHILTKNGIVHLKTDSRELFDYTLEVLKNYPYSNLEYTFDLYNSAFLPSHKGIQTKYEKLFLEKGKKINYLKFSMQS